MSVIKINAITVPEDSGEELGHRFAARHGSMEGTPGFEGFELLQPTDGRHVWLVVTRWASEEDFENWRSSAHFRRSHAQGGDADSSDEGEQARPAVGMSSELWTYQISVTG
ncbi:antibiotic biosynthesis monooxygenase [Nesterenkonia sp. HG001]|uniref:antibiotic biosynthesis monooxygenase family protein n=1 Tax=Nesterenkonia sp. HG001 TaxID=2983207 RepID=UPI002AC5F74E|nr:antibiotic biosynthesis monooxygenase [Nesterenkonia sp. HG001]MDZ5079086.1 antibiotic biosynthesis monooxygenase [Nesterenkonia sp. HG001]